ELIVSAATQPEILQSREAAPGHGLDVIELQSHARIAAIAIRRDECALPSIALEYRALHGCRHATWIIAAAAHARAGGLREPFALELRHQCLESAVDQLGNVSGRQRVTEQRLRVAHQLFGLVAERDLKRGAARRERRETRIRRRDFRNYLKWPRGH